MSANQRIQKKTIYIDVDEEITGIIDKVRAADEKILALVVPKRASTFLSAVNMKLLKRAADQSGKKLVLITSHQNVMPLAGLAGIHVAPNLNSKPFVPSLPDEAEVDGMGDDASIEIESGNATENVQQNDLPAKASSAPQSKSSAKKQTHPANAGRPTKAPEAIAVEAATPEAVKAAKTKKPNMKVPNFGRFRLLLIVGGVALVAFVVFGYWALAIAPKATATIRGETKTSSLGFVLKADTKATALDGEKSVVPSKIKELKKSENEKVAATGQKDKGNKASGTVTLKNCSKSDGSINIPAGTGVSSGDLTFITQAAVALDPSEFTGGGTCKSDTKEVAVMAQTAGDKYNVAERTYTVAGFSGVTAAGSSMTGGTSQIVKVVAAADIESAKAKLANKQAGATEELKAGLNAEGYVPLVDTFTSTPGNYVPTPAVDSEANEVIVTVENKYSMIGIKKTDLQELIKIKAGKDGGVDLTKQSILDDGLGAATYQLGANAANVTDVTIKTNVIAGPDINTEVIKKEIAGKKRGIAEQQVATRPGIKEVRIDTKPFWNYSVPKNLNKITIIVEEANGNVVKP